MSQLSPPPDDLIAIVDDPNEAGQRIPMIAATGQAVGEFVDAAHGLSVDETLAGTERAGLDRDSVDALLVYCAERRCADTAATCPGCRLRAEALGWHDLSGFLADHARIELEDEDTQLTGKGSRTARFATLVELNETWSGREYWFFARRVLRKLRHGLRRSGVKLATFADDGETPAVVLVEPQLADNIGMVARAMGNFGLDSLRLVAARDGWPNEKARVAASGANYIIDAATHHDSLEDALAEDHWVCATTARQRDMRKPVMTPAQAAEEMAKRIAAGQRCSMIFGRESSGLSSDEVARADAIVMIPVNTRFASLNLAQAVLLLGYSFMLTGDRYTLGRVTRHEKPTTTGVSFGRDTPATKRELDGLFEHLEGELDRRGFFVPAHRKPTVVRNLRTMLARVELSAQEVRTLRGIVATLTQRSPRDPEPEN